jgi:hypothetical protein
VGTGGDSHSVGWIPSHNLSRHRDLPLHEVFQLRILLPTGIGTALLFILYSPYHLILIRGIQLTHVQRYLGSTG